MLLAERDRLAAHFSEAAPGIVLAVQDTTDGDLTGKRSSARLGSLNYPARKGYQIHNHLLFDTKGIAIGLFDQYLWGRNAEYFGQDRALWPLKDKESYRWLGQFEALQTFFSAFPQHTVVEICDREGDFYEMYQARRAPNVHLLIRSNKDKALGGGKKLWATMASPQESRSYQTQIYDNKGKKHEIHFRVKYCRVTIPATYRARRDQPAQSPPVELNAVLVEQTSPVQSWQDKPIRWRLLTTLSVENFDQAIWVVECYIHRWHIEEFHTVLKQGAHIEDLQLKEPDAVKNAVTFYSLLAWKILNLRRGASEQPHEPIENYGFSQKEFRILTAYLYAAGRIKAKVETPCTGIGEFAEYVGILVTTSRPPKNKPPGVRTLWAGIEKLHFLITVYEIFT